MSICSWMLPLELSLKVLLCLQHQMMPLLRTWRKRECIFLLCYSLSIERRINRIVFTKGIQELFSPCIWDTNYNSKSWSPLLSGCFLRVGKEWNILSTNFPLGDLLWDNCSPAHTRRAQNLWQSCSLRLPHFMFPAKTISSGKAPRSHMLRQSKMKRLN